MRAVGKLPWGGVANDIALVLYFLSSGVAFVAMYKWPNEARQRFYSWFYAPLEAAARNFYSFAQAYTKYQHWCWRAAGKPGIYWDEERWTTENPLDTDAH